MKRWIVIVACMGLLALSGCRGGRTPAASEPSASGPASRVATPSPRVTGSAELACLIAGSPWTVSKPDLESQFRGVMRGIDVTSVHIVGDQTLTVTPDLHATITDDTTTTITVNMSDGITMVMTQKHNGTAAGQWTADGNTLTPLGGWTGAINTKTHIEINGRSGNSPIHAPETPLGAIPLTYTCADGTLNLTVQGSPFVYLFN